MAATREQATYKELHVTYPDESLSATIYQFVYDDMIKRIPKDGLPILSSPHFPFARASTALPPRST